MVGVLPLLLMVCFARQRNGENGRRDTSLGELCKIYVLALSMAYVFFKIIWPSVGALFVPADADAAAAAATEHVAHD